MAGYSGTPLPRKLGIKEGSRAAFIGAPLEFAAALGELPTGVALRSTLRGPPVDVTVFFATRKARLEAMFPMLRNAIHPDGAVWIAWPKKASGVASDVDEHVVRDLGLAAKLVDVKVCAIDEVWSGLKFVIRKADRPASGKRGV